MTWTATERATNPFVLLMDAVEMYFGPDPKTGRLPTIRLHRFGNPECCNPNCEDKQGLSASVETHLGVPEALDALDKVRDFLWDHVAWAEHDELVHLDTRFVGEEVEG